VIFIEVQSAEVVRVKCVVFFSCRISLFFYSFPQPNGFLISFTTHGMTPWTSCQLDKKACTYTWQHNIKRPRTNIRALSGTRTSDFSLRALKAHALEHVATGLAKCVAMVIILIIAPRVAGSDVSKKSNEFVLLLRELCSGHRSRQLHAARTVQCWRRPQGGSRRFTAAAAANRQEMYYSDVHVRISKIQFRMSFPLVSHCT
jgi:hypothetical protein